jgi:hypothetical protein
MELDGDGSHVGRALALKIKRTVFLLERKGCWVSEQKVPPGCRQVGRKPDAQVGRLAVGVVEVSGAEVMCVCVCVQAREHK